MNSSATTGNDFIADLFHSHWLLFILLGGLLIVAGGVAIVVPAVSSMAPNEVLGLVLLVAVGGVLVYLDPFPGVVTITILMAMVFAAHGLAQIVFAIRVRRFEGWGWFLGSGCLALVAAGLLLLKLPYGHTFTPATVGGVSLLCVGSANVAVAL